jgi:hypothetical protein
VRVESEIVEGFENVMKLREHVPELLLRSGNAALAGELDTVWGDGDGDGILRGEIMGAVE